MTVWKDDIDEPYIRKIHRMLSGGKKKKKVRKVKKEGES